MDCTATRLSFQDTHFFSKIILDYVDGADRLLPFYRHAPGKEGLRQAIEERKKFDTNREVLVAALTKQYESTNTSDAVKANIASLALPNTFTIVTAHQPNLFTGPLYFIYKIAQVIKLVDYCRNEFPGNNFVPVYYMGSEDADLAELGHLYLNGEKLGWDTKQTGAVGLMKVDRELIALITAVEGQLSVLPFGNEIISVLRDSFTEGRLIQEATFELVNYLFRSYGLVVLIPDTSALKGLAAKIFEDDLLEERPAAIVDATAKRLEAAGYKQQASPRAINLFYLKEGMRDRIVKENEAYSTHDSHINFTKTELLEELQQHPERFSPNVILRGIYQETILPNLMYVGGGGEIAYWLQLKDLFAHYKVPFPILLVRNSFLIVGRKSQKKMQKLGITTKEVFLSAQQLLNHLVKRDTTNQLQLNGNIGETEALYESIKKQVEPIDATLIGHVEALKVQSLYRLQELQKKMLRAEKRKFGDHERQVHYIKEQLFPRNNLQERVENFMSFYAKSGPAFIKTIYDHSLNIEQEFIVLTEK